MKVVHELKTLQPYFTEVASGNKTFEVRKNDRNFKVGDILKLMEFDQVEGLTGRAITAKVSYMLDDSKYCKKGYVVLGMHIIAN